MFTILMVEDNKTDQFYNEIILEEVIKGVQIIKVFDGQEALEHLKDNDITPDLILLDINMPRMNGHDFLEVFSENNSKEIPIVVMLTSSDNPKDKKQALDYKCVKNYLLKPINIEEAEKLKELIAEYK